MGAIAVLEDGTEVELADELGSTPEQVVATLYGRGLSALWLRRRNGDLVRASAPVIERPEAIRPPV